MQMIPASLPTCVNDYLMPGQSRRTSVSSFNYVYFIFVRYLFWQQHSPLGAAMSFVLCRLLFGWFSLSHRLFGGSTSSSFVGVPRFAFKFAHYPLTPVCPATPHPCAASLPPLASRIRILLLRILMRRRLALRSSRN